MPDQARSDLRCESRSSQSRAMIYCEEWIEFDRQIGYKLDLGKESWGKLITIAYSTLGEKESPD